MQAVQSTIDPASRIPLSASVVCCWLAALALLGVAGSLAGRPAHPVVPAFGQEAFIVVDMAHPLGAISPLIYGMASASREHFTQLRVPLARWGGNPSTRYNWARGNSWNAARDWHFANGNYGSVSQAARQPSGCADQNIADVRANHAQMLLTVPTLGWVARDDNANNMSQDVPAMGGPPVTPGSEAIAGYDPTANRQRVSIRSLPRKGRPFKDPPAREEPAVYQDEWIHHLTRKFGASSQGGVRYYALDNEPDLWDTTHTDMHPVQPDYDELLQRFLTYSDAIKDVDAGAQITGPVSWGWSGYFFSPRDRGTDRYATHADRRAHGNQPFLPWFLQQAARHERQTGRRALDVLDVHFYPQAEGVYAGKTDGATNALRLRSTRALWDANYVDESWIAAPVQLLPRLHQWVERNYPGTKIGLTEWNWGAENTLNGGLAVAEVLGILGRERVDMACYWMAPPPGSPSFLAYKMYRNADGRGHGFGDTALSARSAVPDMVSCYAARDGQQGDCTLMLINKGAARQVVVKIQTAPGQAVPRRAQVWRYDGDNLKTIVQSADTIFQGGATRLYLPAESMALLRCSTL